MLLSRQPDSVLAQGAESVTLNFDFRYVCGVKQNVPVEISIDIVCPSPLQPAYDNLSTYKSVASRISNNTAEYM